MPTDPTPWPTTLVDLIRWVVTDFDPLEALDVLSGHCVTALPAVAGGILLVDHSGALRLAGASHHSAEVLELFQLEKGEGPCMQCCRSGQIVVDTELSHEGAWPELAAEARTRGFAAIYALPLTTRGVTLGALNLFCSQALDPNSLQAAHALADVATVMILQADPHDEHVLLARTLRRILEARSTVEQAKGILAARHELDLNGADDRLREEAEQAGLSLTTMAAEIVQHMGRIVDPDRSGHLPT